MVSLIILFALLFGLLMGFKRGFLLQVMHLTGYIISFVVASIMYKKIAEPLSLWIPYPELPSDDMWAMFLNSMPLETAFYNGISFAIVFFATKIILQIITSMLDFIANLPVLRSVNKLLGAILGFFEVYLLIFIILFIAALIPLDIIQEKLSKSTMATLIVEHTPILTKFIENLWFQEALNMFMI